MGEHNEIFFTVLPLVLLIIAVVIHLSYASPDICDEDNYTPLEVFQQKIVKNSSELCVIPITPSLFKWSKNPDSVNQIEYNARISNHPDLPTWLQYTYDEFRSEGFLYGVPPPNLNSINLHVIAWNREDDYGVRKLIISMDIMQQLAFNQPPPLDPSSYNNNNKNLNPEYIVEIKIDNMNTRDLFRGRRMDKIIGVFTKYLNWVKLNGEPVRPIYLASAVELGENRVPLKSTESEGVILHLASDRNFSLELYKLESEVLPLWKLRPCPRDVKRTSMERYFRSENILFDWCSFRLVTKTPQDLSFKLPVTIPTVTFNDSISPEAEIILTSFDDANNNAMQDEVFYFKDEIPQKSYIVGIILATIIPGTIGSVLGFLLLVLFWQDREEDAPVCRRRDVDEDSFDNNNPILGLNYPQHHQNLYRSPTGDENVVLITRDRYSEPPKELNDGSNGGRERTPLPPQYGDTHLNGSPALIYAV